MSEPKSYIVYQETPRHYRTEIPNIVFEMLEKKLISHSDFILYSTYRRIAGQSGACWIGTRGLEKKCGLSHPTIAKSKRNLSKPFKILGNKPLINITPGCKKEQTTDTVTIIDVWPENFHHFQKSPTCEKRRHRGVKKEDTEELTIEEETNYYCEPPPVTKKPKKEPPPVPMPAGGNNNSFYDCLKKCTDLSDRQKHKLTDYPEHIVEQAVRYAYHPTTVITGGPLGRYKLLQYFLKNPGDFAETMKNLGKPKKTSSPKEIMLGKFKREEVYNGYEFLYDDIGVGFFKSGMIQPYSVNHKDANFSQKFLDLLRKLKIEYE